MIRGQNGNAIAVVLPRDAAGVDLPPHRVPGGGLVVRIGTSVSSFKGYVVHAGGGEDLVDGVAGDLGGRPVLVLVVVDGVGGPEGQHFALFTFRYHVIASLF